MSRLGSRAESSDSASITTSKASAATDCLQAGMAEPHEEALAPQARFERLDFIDIAGRLLGLGIGLLGVLVVGLDVLGHVFCLFS